MFKTIDEFLKGLPVNAILRERVSQLYGERDKLIKENAMLQKEKADLLRANHELMEEIAEIKALADEFVPHRGLKIRKILGGYDETVAYCAQCKPPCPMSSASRMKVLECSICGYKSSIQARHLSVVISELKGEDLPSWWRKY